MKRQETVGQCSICDREGPTRRGWCMLHYARWYRTGDPHTVRRRHGHTAHKTPFTRALWDQWMKESATYSEQLREGIESFRRQLAVIDERAS